MIQNAQSITPWKVHPPSCTPHGILFPAPPRETMGATSSDELSAAALATYARFWCLHQLAPFIDQTIGLAGAMDHRMIDRQYDWWIRLPLVIACFSLPSPPTPPRPHCLHSTLGLILAAPGSHLALLETSRRAESYPSSTPGPGSCGERFGSQNDVKSSNF